MLNKYVNNTVIPDEVVLIYIVDVDVHDDNDDDEVDIITDDDK